MPMLERHWYRLTPVSVLLSPLSLVFCLAVHVRRLGYRLGIFSSVRLPVPVIVVGNITVGGTGKTPLVIWLARLLRAAGYQPGIVTRGYRGTSRHWPVTVTTDTPAAQVGDEAVVLARRSECPVRAGPDRVAAALQHVAQGCDVIISDDGLQHYRLRRDLEIAVIDGVRRFGNQLCLPAGPLREPINRLRSVALRVTNGVAQSGERGMSLVPTGLYPLSSPPREIGAVPFTGTLAHAIAGIGNPERFFTSLRQMGLTITPHVFPDHYRYQSRDLEFGDDLPVIMTEKDAVKCETLTPAGCWVLAIEAHPDERVGEFILQRLGEIIHGQKAA